MTSVVFPHVKVTECFPRVFLAQAVFEVTYLLVSLHLPASRPPVPVPMQLVGKREFTDGGM
ncbi:hypothetical protein HPB50_007037 [Hyalomma asiaticum]|uniref:Uncharacterized protein n=1 Tax=Hyalomma asiaticum TaxID=266040 RepID=A0ACB7SWC7_HYAAI|nr:hypothetical protein HPB50_007037 [Hyalomma asiaticum]